MGALKNAPRYISPTQYAERYLLGLDEFYAIATLAPSILPSIVNVAGDLRILDRGLIGGPALAAAQAVSPDDDPEDYVTAAEFCAEYDIDHEALLHLAFRGKLPNPRRAANGETVVLHRGEVRLWELGCRTDVAGV